MNISKIAFFSASWLIIGATALSASSFAADSPVKKPAASKSIAKPGTHDMKDHCDEHEAGMMGGHMGDMIGGHDSGMMTMESPRMNMVMSLDLNDEQRSKAYKLSDELKHNNWATMGLIMDESAKLRELYAADKPDPSAIGKVYQKMFDLQRQMIEATITIGNRAEELLTPEQRAQIKNMRRKGEPERDCPMH